MGSAGSVGERRSRSRSALLTGLHEPRATHLAMLGAIAGLPEGGLLPGPRGRVAASTRSCPALAGLEYLRLADAEALREGYLWHEFGDLRLILS